MYNAHDLDVTRTDLAGRAKHPGGQGHPGARHPGRRRCGTRRQLVRLDQLALPGIPGAGTPRDTGPPAQLPAWHLLRVRPQRRASSNRCSCRAFGAVDIGPATVNTELPLPDTVHARLTMHSSGAQLHRRTGARRAAAPPSPAPARPTVHVAQPVSLGPRERSRDLLHAHTISTELTIADPDLWWPYTMGGPDLYDLRLDFIQNRTVTTSRSPKFGIRTVTPGPRHDDGPVPGLTAATSTCWSTAGTFWSAAPPTPRICSTTTTPTATRRSCATSKTSA